MLATAIIALLLAALIAVYAHDRRQTQHTILRNYPIVGYVRYFAETLGEYMRQYQYLPDWSERPFNRLERGVGVPVGQGRLQPAQLRQRKRAGLRLPQCRLSGAGGGKAAVARPRRSASPKAPAPAGNPIPPVSFFNISGMSYGALSHAAVSALSRGAKARGHLDGDREGGLAPYHLEGGCDVIMQMGTAKYGVRNEDGRLSDARLRDDRRARAGADVRGQAGAGRQARQRRHPARRQGHAEIAAIRGIPAGRIASAPTGTPTSAMSENRPIRRSGATVTGKPVGVKFVVGDPNFLEAWFRTACCNPQGCPDYVQIDGGEGGTGAAPSALIDYVGLPITVALPMVAAARERHGLKDRIRIIASAKLITPDKVAWALCMGADFVSSARGSCSVWAASRQ